MLSNEMKKRVNRRGISPVIATVLLIAMVVVIGLIVFIWFRGFVGEGATKFGKNIQLVCDDVDFDAEYSGGELSVVNVGTVPIFQLRVRIIDGGSHSTEEIDSDTADWEDAGLGEQEAFVFTNIAKVYEKIDTADKLIVFPVLLGSSSKGRKTYICEGDYGKEIILQQ